MTSSVETITRVSTPPNETNSVTTGEAPAGDWWSTYRASLDRGSMTESAKRVVELDSRYIVDRCIPSPEVADAWTEARLRRGLIVGAVQSGKTASMLGVGALCLDRKIDVLVVLAGTRTALWRQTYERLVSQLDGADTAAKRSSRRLVRTLIPDPSAVIDSDSEPALDKLYHVHPNQVIKSIGRRRPLIAVVLKQVDHITYFGDVLRTVMKAAIDATGRKLHCVVLDDEADDGSILDRDVELATSDGSDLRKQIPRHIARLWSGSRPPHTTFDDRFFATYVAYTATPQANLLQSDHNPLAPSEFLVALRVPQGSGNIEPPRSSTYVEERGIRAYYTGGELFYRSFRNAPEQFCISPDVSGRDHTVVIGPRLHRDSAEVDTALLGDALRSYFVAGAMRLYSSRRRMSAARGVRHASVADIKAVLPDPHTMLIHPSVVLESHFEVAEQVSAWSRSKTDDSTATALRDPDGNPVLDPSGLQTKLEEEEDRWRRWFLRHRAMEDQLATLPGAPYVVVPDSAWEAVRKLLVEEVFPYTRLVVINSDPKAQDRPEFEPSLHDTEVRCPRDTFAIFIAGNVMSRGLTVEGLTTTIFLRSTDDPAADTQMQMQRWFGYRGGYLPWCRVFVRSEQLNLFRAYHENDEALRADIIQRMNESESTAPSPLVLQGREFAATRKVSNLRNLALHPGATPFVRVIETKQTELMDSNRRILTRLLEDRQAEWQTVVVNSPRGLILREPLSLLQAAELLEGFRYSHHRPTATMPEYARWESIARHGGIEAPESPVLRLPKESAGPCTSVSPINCPYSIAAYLRFWFASLTRHVRGVFPTDRRDLPWSMCSLKELHSKQPRFYVGIRFGDAQPQCADPVLARWGVRPMRRDVSEGIVGATWGTRGYRSNDDLGYLGDQLFDYHFHKHTPPPRIPGEPLWRPRGAPGLILFHVIDGSSLGLDDLVTVGLAVPHGGPDHFAALRGDGTSAVA